VKEVAVSEDGNMIATVGFTAGGAGGNAYADHRVMVFDVRMMSRGGTPVQFGGAGGRPAVLEFVPGMHTPTLMVGSGKVNGGLQLLEPYGDPAYSK
jgi:hypothetical protein